MLTSELIHANFAHILSNTAMTLVWASKVEHYYGSQFFFCLNLFIGLLSNTMTIYTKLFQAYYLPQKMLDHETGGP